VFFVTFVIFVMMLLFLGSLKVNKLQLYYMMGINAPVVVLCLCCIHFNSNRNVSAAALVV